MFTYRVANMERDAPNSPDETVGALTPMLHTHFKKGIASVASQLQSLIENDYYHYLRTL